MNTDALMSALADVQFPEDLYPGCAWTPADGRPPIPDDPWGVAMRDPTSIIARLVQRECYGDMPWRMPWDDELLTAAQDAEEDAACDEIAGVPAALQLESREHLRIVRYHTHDRPTLLPLPPRGARRTALRVPFPGNNSLDGLTPRARLETNLRGRTHGSPTAAATGCRWQRTFGWRFAALVAYLEPAMGSLRLGSDENNLSREPYGIAYVDCSAPDPLDWTYLIGSPRSAVVVPVRWLYMTPAAVRLAAIESRRKRLLASGVVPMYGMEADAILSLWLGSWVDHPAHRTPDARKALERAWVGATTDAELWSARVDTLTLRRLDGWEGL